MLSLSCPVCNGTLVFEAKDGDLVKCPDCGATSELRDDFVDSLTMGDSVPVQILKLVSPPPSE